MNKKRLIFIAIVAFVLIAVSAVIIIQGGKGNSPDDLSTLLTSAAREELAPVPEVDDADMELFEEAMAQLGKEPSPADKMMAVYAKLVAIRVTGTQEGVAALEVDAPDLAGLLTRFTEAAKSPEDADNIEADIQEALESGDFELKTRTLSVNYKTENGNVVIEDTAEYWDAIYGGMLTLQQELLQKLFEVAE